jgi:Trk K+ transport system NAD-binding subunit
MSDTMLFPGDRIILFGEQSQISLCIGNHEDFAGKVLRQINLRNTYGVGVTEIHRESEKIVDISAETELQESNILLLTNSDHDIREWKNKLGMDQSA